MGKQDLKSQGTDPLSVEALLDCGVYSTQCTPRHSSTDSLSPPTHVRPSTVGQLITHSPTVIVLVTSVLLHNSYSATTALKNYGCTNRCISKQMRCKKTFSHSVYIKSLEFYENYITLFCL
jgi:hypothetical protein